MKNGVAEGVASDSHDTNSKDLGAVIRGLRTTSNQGYLNVFEVPSNKWQYFGKEGWTTPNSNDVIIQCQGKYIYVWQLSAQLISWVQTEQSNRTK